MFEKPQFSCEHRLGLVVYGGVSLAIYMNGICQEFYNAVRGRGIYKLIKALTDADIVVDIVSGTSAGGINGVLLSYALANTNEAKQENGRSSKQSEIKFEKFSEVWKNSGDIQKLLFSKEYDKIEKASFLNGTGYYKPQVKQALKDRWDDLKKSSPEDNWFSEFGELDLFITGTDLLGRIYQIFDNTGSVIDVKDHRATFHLKYRDYGNNDFKRDDDTCEALAKLCQITSCFPVAFPPVTVKLDSQNDVDAQLVKWGSLKKNRLAPSQVPESNGLRSLRNPRIQEIDDDPGKGYRLHFVDGGVLANRPFTPTIKAIYHRTAERPVFRKLFYVDPSPDCFRDSPTYQGMLKPNIAQVALSSLIGMPGYQSINNDLELIKEHNEKVRRYKFLWADIENLLDQEVTDAENKDIYDQQKNVYLRTRLTSLKDKLLPLIFIESNDFLTCSTKEATRKHTLDKIADKLTRSLIDPERDSQRLKLLERLGEEIRNLDIDYALRRYLFIADYVYRLLDEDYLDKWLKRKNNLPNQSSIRKESLDKLTKYLTALIKDLNQKIKVLEAIKINLYNLFSSDPMEKWFFALAGNGDTDLSIEFPAKFYGAMLWLHRKFLNLEFPLDSSIAEVSKALERRNDCMLLTLEKDLSPFLKESSNHQTSSPNQLAEQSILKTIAMATEEFFSEVSVGEEVEPAAFLQNKLKKYFCEFEKIDTFLYPLDYLGGVSEKQVIETYRISPEDAKLGLSSKIEDGNRLKNKLAGDSLNAFGGFFKKSWRANDILWGRLDGLNKIIEALVSEEKIKNFPVFLKRQSEKYGITTEEYLDRLLDEAFCLSSLKNKKPSSNDKVNEQYLKKHKEEIKEKLRALFPGWEIEVNTNNPLRKTLLEELVKSLVFAGHLIVLDQELDDTMQLSIEEQLSWKSQKRSLQKSKTPHFNPIEGKFSSAVTLLVAKEFATKSLASMSLEEKENFFFDHYKIGLETLENIPKSEVRNIGVRLIYILKDVLRTWRCSSLHNRPSFWSQFGFTLLGFIIVAVLNIFVRSLKED
jgi:patatin-related protein